MIKGLKRCGIGMLVTESTSILSSQESSNKAAGFIIIPQGTKDSTGLQS